MNYNVNFKGFSNIFCAYNTPVDNKRITYFGTILNDENVADLTEYKKLRHMQGLPDYDKNSDILVLTHVFDSKNNVENLYLNNKDMYFGEELLAIEEKYIPRLISNKEYEAEKKLHMKAYTLLASLTKRMIPLSLNYDNEGETRVIEKIYQTFLTLTKNNQYIFNQEQAFHLLNLGCLKCIKFQDVALFFNKGIDKTMKEGFFKL